MDDLTQDFVQNFANLRENNKEGVLRGLINSLDTDDLMDINLLGLLVELGSAVLERRTQSAEAESEAGDPDADFENLSSRLDDLRAEDGSDNTNEESSSSNQLDESVEVDPQEPTTAVATDYTDLYQETFPPGQASQLGQSVGWMDDGWRDLPRAFSTESEGATGPVIDVLGDVDPMEQGDNIIDYHGLLPKKPKRTKRKKKKKKPYEDLIITQKKHLKKLQKMSEKLSKKMSKTKKKRRKKKVSDSY